MSMFFRNYIIYLVSLSCLTYSQAMEICQDSNQTQSLTTQQEFEATQSLAEAMNLIVTCYPKYQMFHLLRNPNGYHQYMGHLHQLAIKEYGLSQDQLIAQAQKVINDIIYQNLSWRVIPQRHNRLVVKTEQPYLEDSPYEHNVNQFIAKIINPAHKIVTYEALVECKQKELIKNLTTKPDGFVGDEASFESFFVEFKEKAKCLEPHQIEDLIDHVFSTLKPSLALAKQVEAFVRYIGKEEFLCLEKYNSRVEQAVMIYMSIEDLPTNIRLAEATDLMLDHGYLFKDYLKMIISRDARFSNEKSGINGGRK